MKKKINKIHTPLKLTNFDIVESKKFTTKEHVENDIKDMLNYVYQQEYQLFTDDFYIQLASDLVSGKNQVKGSLNSWSRKVIHPASKSDFQQHNLSEMFRQSVMEKTAGYVQKVALFDIVTQYNSCPTNLSDVLQGFKLKYPHLKYPTYSVIKTVCHIYFNKKESVIKKPTASQTLKLYACDMHFSKAELNNSCILLKIKTKTGGLTTLKFSIPHDDRFLGNKVSRPTIRLNDKNKIEFCFTIQSEVEQKETSSYLGIDLGKVEPFVGTVVDSEKKNFSAPYHASRKTNKLQEKIDKKYELANNLLNKSKLCEQSGHIKKSDVLLEERKRVLNKANRLKAAFAHSVSHDIVEIADRNNSTIVFENLSWLSHLGGKWNHSEIQKNTEISAQRNGLPVKKVSAKNTSQTCSQCGGKVTHYKRHNKCIQCHKKINRDVSASRVIATRAANIKFLSHFKQTKSTQTQVLYTVPTQSSAVLLTGEVMLPQGEKNYIVHSCEIKNVNSVVFLNPSSKCDTL